MKRHGLWRFHYEAREVRRIYVDVPARWWMDDEVSRTYRMIACLHSGWGRTSMWSNADAIVVCARRYASLYRQPIINVGQWNALCLRIAERAGFTHHATLKSCVIDNAPRLKSVISFSADYGRQVRPSIDRSYQQVIERAASFASIRQELLRIDREYRNTHQPTLLDRRFLARHCALCGAKKTLGITYLPSQTKAFDETLEPVRAAIGTKFYLCFQHKMAFHKIVKAARTADLTTAGLRVTKRKIRESTKVTARTDGSPVIHNGGSDQWGRERERSEDSAECGHADY